MVLFISNFYCSSFALVIYTLLVRGYKSEELTLNHADKHRQMSALAFTISVQTGRSHEPVPVPTRVEFWAEDRLSLSALRSFELPLIVVDSPDQLTIRDLFQICNALLLLRVCLSLLSKFELSLFQLFLRCHDDIVEHSHVTYKLGLAVLGKFVSTTL